VSAAARVGLAALVEVHDEGELERALAAGATIVGVNNRNLRSLDVDLSTARTMGSRLPRGVIGVAESGIRTRDDVRELATAGFHAFLVGERFMTAPDPGAALSELIG
jgi:indole-3-glycerol phosphate synthase